MLPLPAFPFYTLKLEATFFIRNVGKYLATHRHIPQIYSSQSLCCFHEICCKECFKSLSGYIVLSDVVNLCCYYSKQSPRFLCYVVSCCVVLCCVVLCRVVSRY